MTENVPRIPHAAATVSEMASIRRTAIDRSWNMGKPRLRDRYPQIPRKCLTTDCFWEQDRRAATFRRSTLLGRMAAARQRHCQFLGLNGRSARDGAVGQDV